MAVAKIDIEEFVRLSKRFPVIDVRSEAEYAHAHFPEAVSLPLFNNEERKIVGTIYKQQGRQAAIKTGLDYVGKKMRTIIEAVEKITAKGLDSNETSDERSLTHKTVLVHCWRGGMRSGSIAWLLDMYGFKVYALAGGYKAFRNWAIKKFEKERNLKILGGYTGSGKTYVLRELQNLGEKVVDLEGLANHKGSAFGNIGLPAQPSQEMFENLLSFALHNVDEASNDTSNIVWVEDESQRIGSVNIPINLWRNMRKQTVYFLDISFEDRLCHIVNDYGNGDKEKQLDAIKRIQKKLGGLEAKTASQLLLQGNIKECSRILLKYYDKLYLKGLNNREAPQPPIIKIICDTVDAKGNAKKLIETVNDR